jgi:hypothetical protein
MLRAGITLVQAAVSSPQISEFLADSSIVGKAVKEGHPIRWSAVRLEVLKSLAKSFRNLNQRADHDSSDSVRRRGPKVVAGR